MGTLDVNEDSGERGSEGRKGKRGTKGEVTPNGGCDMDRWKSERHIG